MGAGHSFFIGLATGFVVLHRKRNGEKSLPIGFCLSRCCTEFSHSLEATERNVVELPVVRRRDFGNAGRFLNGADEGLKSVPVCISGEVFLCRLGGIGGGDWRFRLPAVLASRLIALAAFFMSAGLQQRRGSML